MKGYFSKKLQNNSSLYKELLENQKLYYEHSFEKENKQKNFLKYNQNIASNALFIFIYSRLYD